MDGQLPLYEKGVQVGAVRRREEGLYCVFQAQCFGGEGIRKVWLCSETGKRLLLGTLVPEGKNWGAARRLVRRELELQGVTGRLWGEIVSGETECSACPCQSRDPLLAKLFAARRDGRWMSDGKNWRVSFSWQVGQPVPWLPLVCFARPGWGELCFYLDERGYPVTKPEISGLN